MSPVTLAVVGDRDPDHVTHRALDAAMDRLPSDVRARWIASDTPGLTGALASADAIWFAPGTPHRDPDAVLAALQHARTAGIPSLGTCGGFQLACIEIARNVLGLAAAHQELEPDAPDPFVAELGCSLLGERRMVSAVAGTRVAAAMGTAPFEGFHWCRFGLPDASVAALQTAGVVVAARAPDAGTEAIELPDHPFFVFTLFQPQVATADPPLLRALISAAR